MTKLSLAKIIDFMEKRCVGVDQSADALRWKLINDFRAEKPDEPPADRKSALDEIVRISEEAGLYNDPAVERELMQRSLELLRAFRHAYEPGTQFPLIGELESFIEKGRRERYISAARNRLMQLGRSEDVATEGAKSLWRTASTETGALTPEKDADEYDVGYEAGRDTL